MGGGAGRTAERRADLAEFGARLLLLHAAVRHQVVEELCARTAKRLSRKCCLVSSELRAVSRGLGRIMCLAPIRSDPVPRGSRNATQSDSHCALERQSSVRVPPPLAYSMTR